MKTELVNSTPARWWSLLGLVLVPLLVAGGFLMAGLTSDHRFGQVRAAVVNLDEPITLNGKYIPLGRQLTANLVDSQRVQNLGWRLDTEANAKAGLANGSYAAMVVIPKNFSAAATSYSKNDAATAERATIELSTSPVAGVADATLGKVVALAAADSLNETLTSGYLENIYVGFNDLGKQFSTMADGATDLAKGGDKLVSGIGDAADGSAKLTSGLKTMADKTSSMPGDVSKLADGTAGYVAGANQLAQSTIDSLPQQVALIGGLKQAADGASGLSGGLSTYKSSLLSQASQASQGATNVQNVLDAAAADPGTYGAAAISAVHSACGVTTDLAHLATAGAGCVGSLKGAAQALQGAAGGLSQEDPSTHQSLLSGASALASSLTDAADQAAAGAPDVSTTTAQLKKLIAGGKKLATGTDQLADGIPALASGIQQAADGSAQLSSGLAQAKTGGTKFTDGLWKLANGITEGKDKVPSYSSSERTDLASVVAQPVATEGLDGLANTNIGWISLLLNRGLVGRCAGHLCRGQGDRTRPAQLAGADRPADRSGLGARHRRGRPASPGIGRAGPTWARPVLAEVAGGDRRPAGRCPGLRDGEPCTGRLAGWSGPADLDRLRRGDHGHLARAGHRRTAQRTAGLLSVDPGAGCGAGGRYRIGGSHHVHVDPGRVADHRLGRQRHRDHPAPNHQPG